MPKIRMKSPMEEFIRFVKNNQQFALLVGAGISKNAGVPLSRDVIDLLKQRYPDKFEENREYGYAEAFNTALPGKEHQPNRRRFIEELWAGKPPTEEHYLIAHLVEHRKFPIVFTTNFDHLTDIALINRCSFQPRIYLYDDDIEPREYSDDFPKLLKLHGDLLFEDLANLEEEMRSRLNENMCTKLLSYLQSSGLVVIGYGGNDETIMNLLQEAVGTKEGIKNGLWWVIYSEKDRDNPRLTKLINETLNHGKRAEIIGPTDAASFFKNLCSSLGLDSPKYIPFGINPKGRNPVAAYAGRFGSARQLPPMDDAESLNSDLSDALRRLEEALKIPGVVWLIGPPRSGKSTLIGKLFAKLSSKRLFYFSHRFAMHPVHSSLTIDLEIYANAIGVPTPRLLHLDDMLQRLFRKNVVLVFDDLFSESHPMKKRFWEILIDIIAVQRNVGRGNLILISSYEPQEEVLIEIHHAMLERAFGKGQPFSSMHGQVTTCAPASTIVATSDQDLQQSMKSHSSRNMFSLWPRNYRLCPEDVGVHILKISGIGESSGLKQSFEDSIRNLFENGPPEVRKSLRVMSLLRFAEYPDVLGRLTEISNMQNVLETLVRDEFVEKRRSKYILRDSVQTFLRRFDSSTIEEDRLNIAQGLENISIDQPYFQKTHCIIETEYHYWHGERFKEAAAQVLKIGDTLIASGNGEFIYHTLLDYFVLEASEKPILSNLEPRKQIDLILLFYKAWQATFPPDYSLFTSLYGAVVKKVLSNLDEAYQKVFAAYHCYLNHDLDGFKKLLLLTEDIFRKGPPSEILGDIQLDLSGCAFSQGAIVQDSEGKKQLAEEGLSWARKAEQTYLNIDHLKGIARARDNIASALTVLGQYNNQKTVLLEALKLEEKQKGLQAAEPGFSSDKAVVYGNLFQCNLLLDNIQEAEGYFYQCILNYAYLGDWAGVLRNLYVLFQVSILLRGDKKHVFPAPHSLYRLILTTVRIKAESREFWAIREIAFAVIYEWFFYNLMRMRLRSALIALTDFFMLSHLIPEEQSVSAGLFMVGILFEKFAKKVTQKQILAAIEKEAPSHLNIYICYSQWLMNPQDDLNKLLKQYKVGTKWGQVMREKWSDCQRRTIT